MPKLFRLPEDFEIVLEDYTTPSSFDDLQPDGETIVEAGDIIFVANAAAAVTKVIKTMPWERRGITVYGGIPIMDLPSYGSLVVEVNVSPSNPFIDRRLNDIAAEISVKYESAIVSAKALEKNETNVAALSQRNDSASEVIASGTAILFVTDKATYDKMLLNNDFTSVNIVEQLEKPSIAWSFFPLVTFLTIVSLVAAGEIEMMPAALSMASFFFVGGWLVPEDIDRYVDLRLLMLMGCSLSFALAMTKTALANRIATEIVAGITDPLNCLFLIYAATLFITEIVSNNAAAALMFPVAISVAKQLNVSYKPFAMIVMNAASMAFMCPIGEYVHKHLQLTYTSFTQQWQNYTDNYSFTRRLSHPRHGVAPWKLLFYGFC